MLKEKESRILLFVLPLIVLLMLAVWGTKPHMDDVTRVKTENGVWDLSGFDFTQEVICLAGEVEYVAEALLTPEDFSAADNIRFGHPHSQYQYCTSRITVRVPPGSYMLSGNSVDFASRLYVNGELLMEAGQPGESRETTVPATRHFTLPASPDENGVITIVQQASNFVHRESGGHGLIYIGSPVMIDDFVTRQFWPEIIVMGCYLVLFVVHIILYSMQRNYPQNLLFALFCLSWFLRSGVTGHKLLPVVLPWLPWQAAFRIEYLALPATCALMIWILNLMFPGILHRWFPVAASVVCCAIAALYLFADTLLMSQTVIPFEILMVVFVLYILARFILKLRRIQAEQLIIMLGFAFFLFAFLWDALHYNGIQLFPALHFAIAEMAMTVFVLFGTVAMVYGTMREVAMARENERIALLEAEALRRDALQREALRKTIPDEHLVERGALALNTLAGQAYLNGKDMLLSPKEFIMLHLLMRHESKVLDRHYLYTAIWQQPMGKDTQAMRSMVSRLRKKLSGSGFTIEYTRDSGYLLVQEPGER